MSFLMIGSFTLVSWGTLGFFETPGSITKDTEVQAWISTDFWWILLPMGPIWHARCLYSGVLGDLGTTLGRSWDDPGTPEGTRKDLVRSSLGFYRFCIDLGDPF